MTWTSQPADGPYTLLARATDNVGNTTDSAPLTVTVNNAPPPDTTAPSAPVLAISETAPEAHVAGSTLFYNPAVGSSRNVTVAATTTDAESGIAQVAFPAVFGSDGSDDTSPPYSTSYSWSAGASATGAKSVTATNGSGLTASSSFTVTPDSAGPSVAITAPAAGATVQNGQAVSATSTDALAGVAQVEFRYCAGATCSFATGTAIGTPDTSAPYGVTWSNQPAPGQYTLLAQATDNVGNITDSTPVTVTNANTSFSDGFESGTMVPPWTSVSGPLVVQQQEVRTGNFAARAASTGVAASASKTLAATQTDLYYRMRFKLLSAPTASPYFGRFRTASNVSILGLFVSSSGKLSYRNDVAGTSLSSTNPLAVVTTGAWHEVQVHLTVNGAAGQVEVWYDGVRLDDMSKTQQNFGTDPIGRLQLGENASGKTFDIAFDDVAADVQKISSDSTQTDTTPPSAPVLAITETAPDAQVAGSTLFYNPTAGHAGTFTVAATTTDAESGITQVAFPAVFGSDAATDLSSPYSKNYNWSAGATASGAKSVTATNGSGLTASSSFTVTPDSAGPSVAITAPAAGATVQNGQAVSATSTDALAGVAQVEFRYCAGATCSFATGTAIGTPDTTAPYGVTWSNQPAPGQYTLLARATDNVGNTTTQHPSPSPSPTTPPRRVRRC